MDTNSEKVVWGASGNRDVLIIVSEDLLNDTDVVERRSAIEMTEEVREKLENQGIPREEQCGDLTIVKARYNLDKHRTIHGVEISNPGGEKLTKESVLKQIASLMNNHSDNGGVMLHYIGHGRKMTGDWCFEDGFITFRDLTQLYFKLFRGRVMTIVSDCSYSGRWIKECMMFLDEHGVGPCGHLARDKGILIKVLTSCLSHQIPQQLSYSVLGFKNDKITGDMFSIKAYNSINRGSRITDTQHGKGQDFTRILCGQQPPDNNGCLCLPHANWEMWDKRKRIYSVNGEDKGTQAWQLLLVTDDDETILQFVEKTQGDNQARYNIDCSKYGEVLKSGLGEAPSEMDVRSVLGKYEVCKRKNKN